MNIKRQIIVFILAVFIVNFKAMAINDQSLKGENTFGLLEDNFDMFFYPEFLADYKGYEIYTNLHNTSGANRFQIGWFGLPENVPGKLFLMFDTTRTKTSGDVLLPAPGFTPAWPNFLNPGAFPATGEQGFYNRVESDFFDDNGDYASDRSIIRNVSGETWNENSQYEFILGYGVPLAERFSLGAGIFLGFATGEARDSRTTFDISYIETDLNTNTVLESYSDRADAKIDVGGSTIGFMIGGKFETPNKTKIGLDVSYALLQNNGIGKYGANSRTATWTRGVETASLSQTISGAVADPLLNGVQDALPAKGGTLGVRLKTYIPVAQKHTLRFDALFESTDLDVSDGRKEVNTSTTTNDPVLNTRDDIVSSDVTDYSGKNSKGMGFGVLMADVFDATNLLQIAFGLGYERVQREFDLKRAYSFRSVERFDTNNDNDAIDAPLDYDPISDNYDMRWTDESAMEQSYNFKATTNYISFPLGAEVKLTKRLNLRLGVEHSIIIARNDEATELISGSLQTKTTYEDGTGTRTVTYTNYAVPDNERSSTVDVTSTTDYRLGLGIEASKNMIIDLLANYNNNNDYDNHIHELSVEPHEASSIWSVFASATIKLD